MRHSSQKHNVARLRVKLSEFEKLNQEEFAELIGCSVQKLRNIESGRTRLDELLARRIADETGISIKWLMDGNLDAPPISTSGREYTKEIYDEVRARKKNFATVQDFNVKLNVLECCRMICAILVNANLKRNYHLVAYRTMKAIHELRGEFGEALDFNTIEKVLAYVQDMQDVPEHLREEVRRIQQATPSGRITQQLKPPQQPTPPRPIIVPKKSRVVAGKNKHRRSRSQPRSTPKTFFCPKAALNS